MSSGLLAVVYKELRHVRRDPATLFLALLIPVVQLLIFGVAIDTEVKDLPTVVVDRAHTRVSRELAHALEATGTFRVVGEVPDRDTALSRMRSGHARAALLFPDDFAERLLAGEPPAVQVLIDGSDGNAASQAQAAALGLAVDWTRRHGGAAGPTIDVRPRLLYNPDGRSESFFVPGLAGIILQLVTMVLTAFAIVREREKGTLEQLLVSPVASWAITLGKIVPAVLIGAAETLLVLWAMVHVFDVPIAGDPGLLAAATGLFLFTSLALGLFISTVARTQLQAMMLTFMILLPSVLLSGFMFPRSSMPTPIHELTYAIPATYFIEILRAIVLRGATAAEIAHWIWPLAAIGLGLSAFAALRLRRALA